jgi:hypothetical protein
MNQGRGRPGDDPHHTIRSLSSELLHDKKGQGLHRQHWVSPDATVVMAPSCPMMLSFSRNSNGNLRLSSASCFSLISKNCWQENSHSNNKVGNQFNHFCFS